MINDTDSEYKSNEKIRRYFENNINRYGVNPISVGWENKTTQDLRFEILLSLIEEKEEPISINDLGCGYGALYDYLIQEKINIKNYYGYDICKDMILKAQEIVSRDKAMFYCSSKALYTADYTFISGTFNLKFDENKDTWSDYIKKILLSAATKTKHGLGFNLLSNYTEIQDENFYYGKATEFFDFCIRNISERVILRHDYSMNEWTLLVKL